MGKGEEESENEDSNDSPPSEEETIDKEEETEESDNQVTTTSEQTQEKTEDDDEVKKDVNDLRKVIKLNQDEEESVKQEKPKKTETAADEELSTRDSLEQKRAILQSIKDFDFQIKKNSEDLTSVNKKLDSVTKDLDDLVSLYEIVSEQMNPFVGLSKVTKKRIEALENFTKEVDDLKNRMNDIEAFAETAGVNLETLKEMKNNEPVKPVKTNKTENQKQENVEIKNDLPVDDLDIIIDRSLSDIDLDKQIDMIIDDFIENLFT
jgi:flagellar protein FlaC